MAHFDSDHVDDDGERWDEPDAKRRQLCQEDRADTDGTDWTRPMDRALELAARGPGSSRCNPNPRVGCVIVSDDTVVGEGITTGRALPMPRSRRCATPGMPRVVQLPSSPWNRATIPDVPVHAPRRSSRQV